METESKQGFEDASYRESTIVNSVRRLSLEGSEAAGVGHAVQAVGDRITLSGESQGNSLCPNEERQQAWLRANRGKSMNSISSPLTLYRPPVLLLQSNRQASPYVLNALSAAAGRLG
jgi:hypothetical protein